MRGLVQKVVFSIVFVIGVLTATSAQVRRYPYPNPKPLLPILQLLVDAGMWGSLEISGICDSEWLPQFPTINKESGGSPLTVLGQMLSSDRGIHVSQDSNGIVRMVEPNIPTDFLNVRISHVTFEDYRHQGIPRANYALLAVLGAPEVIAFFKNHDIEGPFPAETIGAYLPDSPHISGMLDDVTVREALDYILKIFPGIWLYQNCPAGKHKRNIFIRFYHLRNVGGSVSVVS